MTLGLVATWYAYVPVHELLHALGCVAAGGEVTRLEVQAQYGGELLARLFPFVVAGGEYAGRLSGFDTRGSDLVYLATDALPYSLSVLIGVPLLRACTRARRPFRTGAAVVIGLAPFYNLTGDYYEMGSILVTRVAAGLGGDFSGLRSDDLVLLLTQLFSRSAELGLAGEGLALPLLVVAVSFSVGLALAFATWGLGDGLATVLVGRPAQRSGARGSSALEPDEPGDCRDRSEHQQHDQQGVDDADPERAQEVTARHGRQNRGIGEEG
jgi:hypothetical protein